MWWEARELYSLILTLGCQKSSYFDASKSAVRPTNCISFFFTEACERYLSNNVTMRYRVSCIKSNLKCTCNKSDKNFSEELGKSSECIDNHYGKSKKREQKEKTCNQNALEEKICTSINQLINMPRIWAVMSVWIDM